MVDLTSLSRKTVLHSFPYFLAIADYWTFNWIMLAAFIGFEGNFIFILDLLSYIK